MKKINNLYKFIVLLILGGVLFSIWTEYVDITSLGDNLKKINIVFVIIALMTFCFSMVIKTLRWQFIINQISSISFKDCFWILVIGNLVNYIIPLRIGEIVKIGLLKKHIKLDYGPSLTTIFMDKLSDVSLIIWVMIMIPVLQINLPSKIKFGLNTVAIIFLIGICFAIVSTLYKKQSSKTASAKSRNKFTRAVALQAQKFIQAFKILKLNPSKVFRILFFSIFIGLTDAFKVYLLYLALGHQIPILTALFGALARYMFFAIPMPPGQIGSVELIWLSIYSGLYSIDPNIVNSASVTAHAISLACNIMLGFAGMSVMGVSLRKIFLIRRNETI